MRPRRAVTPVVVDPAPAESAPDGPLGLGDYARRITQLLAEGRLVEADLHIAAHAELAADRGSPSDRRDAAAWATMRALLDGRGDDARRKAAEVLGLARRAADPGAESGHRWQRFWIAAEWGDQDERYDLLDECRSRAYTHDELPWRAALSLLLAHLGRRDEAVRELDATTAECEALPHDAARLDIVTNLAEATFLLGDGERARRLHGWLARVPDQLVVVGPGDVCKGSLRRYRAGLAASVGAWAEADDGFRAAADVHRALGARPLLARTLNQWGRTLAGRDELLARRNLQESEELAEELGLAGHGAGSGDPAVPTSA